MKTISHWSLAIILWLGSSAICSAFPGPAAEAAPDKKHHHHNSSQETFGKYFSKVFYIKAHSYLVHSKAFKNFTLKDTINFVDKLETWTPPEGYTQNFPFYQAGYDYDDRPIWVIEVGKYNVKEVLKKNPDAEADLERYAFQGCLRILASMNSNTTDRKDVREYVLLTDWEGLDISQITHLPTVTFVLNFFRNYLEIISMALGQVIAINVNYATQLFFDLARPVLGGFFERIEIYGSNKAKWMGALRRLFPPNSIPAWYGGSSDWKPVQIFG